jgi:hypothetical protein
MQFFAKCLSLRMGLKYKSKNFENWHFLAHLVEFISETVKDRDNPLMYDQKL